MSEVTTLKQLMLDAARYRGLRKMIDSGEYWLTRADYSVAPYASMMDAEVDERLAKENP